MFEKFKKLNTGRVRVKVIATLLALILTFANFTLLGSYIGRVSYATDSELSSQNNKTNSNNVTFEAYLDALDTTVKEQTANINSEDLVLHIAANVKNEGYLKNAKVQFVNTNFAIKGNEGVREFPLNTIETDKGITVDIPIVAISNETYNLGLLNMISQIKLTGEYIDNEGNVTDIESTKNVKVTWKTDEITNDNISLSQEVITNKTYTINGEEKRIIQVLVKSAVKDNIVPVKQTNIEVSVPEIGADPESVNVSSYTTKATNGKTSIEFNDLQTSSWNYNKEEGKVSVEIKNPADESNNVSWVKNSTDEIIITYIYSKDVTVTPFISNAKTTIEVYGIDNNTTIEQTNKIELKELAVVGNLATIDNKLSSEIYKGNLYINKPESFTSTYNVYISYKDLANTINVQDLGDEVLDGESATYYKGTQINKKEAVSVLGQEGTIEIYNAENNSLLQTINLSEVSEGDYITVEYAENVSRILIKTSPAQKEGKIEIINNKEISITNQETISEINKLVSNVSLIVTDEAEKVSSSVTTKAESNIKEPTTKYSVSLDKTNLSTQAENKLQITAELKTENSSNKLFKNPEIRVELPAEIKEASIENITPVLHSDELKLKSYEIVANDAGNKELIIKTEGTQTKYGQNAYIVVDLKVKTDAFMASKNVAIKTTCINDAETITDSKNIALISRTGFVTKNVLKIGSDNIEKINTNKIEKNITQNANFAISSSLINNFGETISNVNIVGNIADRITLTGSIATNIKGAEVYYSAEKITDANSESWTKDLQDLSKVKAFKIVLPSNLEQGAIVEIGYNAMANITGLEENAALTNSLNVNYVVNEQAKQEKIEYVLNANVEEGVMPIAQPEVEQYEESKKSVEISTIAEHPDTIKEWSTVKYIISVKNIGETGSNYIIIDELPEEILIGEIVYYAKEDEDSKETCYTSTQTVRLDLWINPNETYIIEITGIINELEDGVTTKEITNTPKIPLRDDQYIESNSIVNTIIKEGQNIENPEEGQNPGEGGSPGEGQNPGESENPGEGQEPGEDGTPEEGQEPGEDGNPEEGQEPGEDGNPEEGQEPGKSENPEDGQEPGESENPEEGQEPGESENPEEGQEPETKTYSIAGTVWLDENKDGIRATGEKPMQSQKIILLDTKGNVLSEAQTSLTGTYKFADLSEGEYLIAIEYDKDKYTVTKYQAQGADKDSVSDVVSKEMTISGQTTRLGVTDTIKIENSDITNIDMGLIENPIFDLSLNKYVTKITVTTSSGKTSSYDYTTPTNLAKVEIGAKEISGSTLVVEYEIEITNNGDIDGYVTDIIDYKPNELTFNSEMNTEWYMGADNNLHYMAVEPKAIAPGETERVKLVLTRNLKSNSTGTIENTAEIGESTNLAGVVELDSTAGNKQSGEDDISKAELIVSIKTGSPAMYIGIVIISMLVLGAGLYIINKKVIKVNI